MARNNDVWETGDGGTYIQTIGSPNGYDLLINGTNHYINFNSIVGSSGYGFRDNGGVMEFKDSGGSWASFSSGGGSQNLFQVLTVGNSTGDLDILSPDANNGLRVTDIDGAFLFNGEFSNILGVDTDGNILGIGGMGTFNYSNDFTQSAKNHIFKDEDLNTILTLDTNLSAIFSGRLQEKRGDDIISATNITLGKNGNYYHVTGTTNIDTMTGTDWQDGSCVTLLFTGKLTVRHNASATPPNYPFLLANSTNLATNNNNLRAIFRLDTSLSAWVQITPVVIS